MCLTLVTHNHGVSRLKSSHTFIANLSSDPNAIFLRASANATHAMYCLPNRIPILDIPGVVATMCVCVRVCHVSHI